MKQQGEKRFAELGIELAALWEWIGQKGAHNHSAKQALIILCGGTPLGTSNARK